MADGLPEGIRLDSEPDKVVVEIGTARWEGTAAQAERLLSGLHYALGRARPGTAIGSMFVNGGLWGAKVVEDDPDEALEKMQRLVEQMAQRIDTLQAEADDEQPGSHPAELDKP